MAKLTPITKQAIEIINQCIAESKKRNRPQIKNFPLWCALRSIKGHENKIQAVLNGHGRYPFTSQWQAKYILAERIARRYQITNLQFKLIDIWLRKNGYYSRHYSAEIKEVPKEVLDFTLKVHPEIYRWFNYVLSQCKGELSLGAIVNQRLTDLILLKALEITSTLTKRPNLEKEWHSYGI